MEGSLTDEVHLIITGNGDVSVIDDELIKGWFSELHSLSTPFFMRSE